jgi:hypothetical protein
MKNFPTFFFVFFALFQINCNNCSIESSVNGVKISNFLINNKIHFDHSTKNMVIFLRPKFCNACTDKVLNFISKELIKYKNPKIFILDDTAKIVQNRLEKIQNSKIHLINEAIWSQFGIFFSSSKLFLFREDKIIEIELTDGNLKKIEQQLYKCTR